MSAPVRLYRLCATNEDGSEPAEPCHGGAYECGSQCWCWERVSAWNFWHGVAIAGALECSFSLGMDPVRWMPNADGDAAAWNGDWPWEG